MSKKFFYLYLAAGVVALLILIYRLFVYSFSNDTWITINVVAVILMFYMAYKVRREKEDKDLM